MNTGISLSNLELLTGVDQLQQQAHWIKRSSAEDFLTIDQLDQR